MTTREELYGLASEWNILLARSRAASLFLRWEWVSSWLEVTSPAIDLFVITVRDGEGELVGVAPYYRARYRLLSLVPYRILRPFADYATGLDYPDWIIREDVEADAASVIAGELALRGRQWDCIWMAAMAGWTGVQERIVCSLERAGFQLRTRPVEFAYLELPERLEDWEAALTSNRRSQLRRQSRKFMSRPGAEITHCETRQELESGLSVLFELHGRRWALKGEQGTFGKKPAEVLFYRSFAAKALNLGWLRLFCLKDVGGVRAVQLGYAYNGVFHQMQEGFDPEHPEGPGNVLRYGVFRACIEGKLREYDFLGEMTEHKRRWCAKPRSGFDLFAGSAHLKSRLLFSRNVWPTGRYLRTDPAQRPAMGDSVP